MRHTHVTVNITRDAFEESKHPREGGKFASAGAASGGDKIKISKSALKEKLEALSHAQLMASLKHPAVDPAVKKHIEKELDDRADRGTMKGHGEK